MEYTISVYYGGKKFDVVSVVDKDADDWTDIMIDDILNCADDYGIDATEKLTSIRNDLRRQLDYGTHRLSLYLNKLK